jgi:hypothetical protein
VPDAEPIWSGRSLSQRHSAWRCAAWGTHLANESVGERGGLARCARTWRSLVMVTTRAHENHAFMVLPLLAMAMPRAGFLVAGSASSR